MNDFIIEKERKTAIYDTVDILVAGGGTAGAVAAIAAARSGAKVLIIEQFGSLGGSATMGMVTPLMNTGIEGNPMCSSISDEINDRLIEMGYSAKDKGNNKGNFDPMILKFVLEDMAVSAEVKILYYSYISDVIMEDGTIKGVTIENKRGRSAVMAARVIDCTGDGDVAKLAGVPFDSGNPDTGKNQPMSVRYVVSGINLDEFLKFMNKLCENKNKFHYRLEYPILHGAVVWDKHWPLEPMFKEAYEAGEITYEDGAYWQFFGIPGRKDSLSFNCPEIFEGIDGTNPEDLTNAQIIAKRAMLRQMKFYKKHFPGFEDAYISETAAQVGIRESRRIKGVYTLQNIDILNRRKFKDHIAKSNYPIDVHGLKLHNSSDEMKTVDNIPYYEIPYRCLVPVGVKGLLVAGRCISAEFIAQSSLRVQPTVRAIGEAAGIAAAMSLKNGVGVEEIKGEDVREEMLRRGAIF